MRRPILAATVGALMALLSIPGGGAGAMSDPDVARGGRTFRTEVVFRKITPPLAKRGTHYFKGVVKSRKKACRNFRPLDLLRDGSVVTSDASDGDARFKIEILAFSPGKYRVSAPVYSGGNGITCRADKSRAYIREL